MYLDDKVTIPQTAFISRNLKRDSPFKRLLEAQGWEVHDRALIVLTPTPFQQAPEADWIFFTSPNGVHFYSDGLKALGLPLPKGKWAAIGPSTAAAMQVHGMQPDFTGSGEPIATATAFLLHAQGLRVLMPGPRHRAGAIAQQLAEYADVREWVVYDNQMASDLPALQEEALAFTSPMNVDAYFRLHALLPGQRVVAIGPTTATALKRVGALNVAVAASPTEEALARAVLHLPA